LQVWSYAKQSRFYSDLPASNPYILDPPRAMIYPAWRNNLSQLADRAGTALGLTIS
jgi:hypothetical protein